MVHNFLYNFMFTKWRVINIMNKIDYDMCKIIKYLYEYEYINQRDISEQLNISLGKVNSCINSLIQLDFLTGSVSLTSQARSEIQKNKPKSAILLAAGTGLRMIPINSAVPKALLKINNEILIERIINQLHEKGIQDIYIVVGFMKERFEYLIDKYKVRLIVNDKYLEKNNIYSLFLARQYISNSYIIPCDLWFKYNPFSNIELQSWYLVSDEKRYTNNIFLNKKHEIVKLKHGPHRMVGLSYINHDDAKIIVSRLEEKNNDSKFDDCFWEEILFDKNKMIIFGKIENEKNVREINTFEELRNIDENSSSLNNHVLDIISETLNIETNEIQNIMCLKKGMTNRSFLFNAKNEKYIMRIPGEGTDQLINRKEEGEVYKAISSLNISDEVLYFNPSNGYKLTRFLNDSRVCDIRNINDLKKTMKLLKKFHNSKVRVNHYFDLFEKIEFYEKLRGNHQSLYEDYDQTKQKVLELKEILNKFQKNYSLTHIDAVPDNFLFYTENGVEKVKLIDWEYASMQDTDVDLAMFCIYAMYEKKEVDQLIDIYYENSCSDETRLKIYCYIAICGLLWSNWCEYKYTLGVEFGEYSLKQYRYAKEYYQIVKNILNEGGR